MSDTYESLSDPGKATGNCYAISAPAKLNIRLKVEGRRADGFHLLSMVNVTTDLIDDLEIVFEETKGVRLEVVGADAGLLSGSDNFVCKAAEKFLNEFNIPLGVSIKLVKRIPLGSGLGGGSSDAAAVFKLMVSLFGEYLMASQKITAKDLNSKVRTLALSVGADVPFFVRATFARVTGIGELIDTFDSKFLAGMPCVIVNPEVRLNTKEVYENFRRSHPVITPMRDMVGERYAETLRLNTAIEGYEPFPSKTIRASLWRQLLAQVGNDLEATAVTMQPVVGECLKRLRALPDLVSGMTGSGSAIFVLSKSLDYFEKNGIMGVQDALNGVSCNLIETRLIGEE